MKEAIANVGVFNLMIIFAKEQKWFELQHFEVASGIKLVQAITLLFQFFEEGNSSRSLSKGGGKEHT